MEITREIIEGLVEAGNRSELFRLAQTITSSITIPLLFVMFLPAIIMLLYGLFFVSRKTENYWIVLALIIIAPIIFFVFFPYLVTFWWLKS